MHEHSQWPLAWQKAQSSGQGLKKKGVVVAALAAGAAGVRTGAVAGMLHIGSSGGGRAEYE